MCRLFATIGSLDGKEVSGLLMQFRDLADCGCVPIGTSKGHKDGWGIVAYRNGRKTFWKRRAKDAFYDPIYLRMLKDLSSKDQDAVIAHLRKASIGKASLANTAPFIQGRYALCQNGTILNSDKIPISKASKQAMKGETDTERIFLWILDRTKILQRGAGGFESVLIDAVRYVRQSFDYTALNMIAGDGEYIWVLREINTKNKIVRRKKLMDYYGLYIGSVSGKRSGRVISSEPLSLRGARWRKLKNHELLRIAIASGRVATRMV